MHARERWRRESYNVNNPEKIMCIFRVLEDEATKRIPTIFIASISCAHANTIMKQVIPSTSLGPSIVCLVDVVAAAAMGIPGIKTAASSCVTKGFAVSMIRIHYNYNTIVLILRRRTYACYFIHVIYMIALRLTIRKGSARQQEAQHVNFATTVVHNQHLTIK